jgi:hypothetical protein
MLGARDIFFLFGQFESTDITNELILQSIDIAHNEKKNEYGEVINFLQTLRGQEPWKVVLKYSQCKVKAKVFELFDIVVEVFKKRQHIKYTETIKYWTLWKKLIDENKI